VPSGSDCLRRWPESLLNFPGLSKPGDLRASIEIPPFPDIAIKCSSPYIQSYTQLEQVERSHLKLEVLW
jgi:hypothetical protein